MTSRRREPEPPLTDEQLRLACEAYIAECARDGLVDSLAINEWRRQAQHHRAEQARLHWRATQLTRASTVLRRAG